MQMIYCKHEKLHTACPAITMKKTLSEKKQVELLATLKTRFEKNPLRHKDVDWAKVQSRLESNPEKLWALSEMERTGGEPDVVGQDKKSGEFIFMDCAQESPEGRRSVCFDRAGWLSRKEARPANTAIDFAAEIGITLLTEEEYLALQKLGDFDKKTSSWIATPPDFREKGGALWGGRSYGRVFIGCNGAQSYYSARGFRGALRV